ncbi:MAG TPA: hypothetical protein VH682_13695 [Gemmataceae bacterium]|jgi:hypothetical protein
MLWIFLIVGYVMSSVEAYYLLRADYRMQFGEWTASDQHLGVIWSLFGPISLIVAVCFYWKSRQEYQQGETVVQRWSRAPDDGEEVTLPG